HVLQVMSNFAKALRHQLVPKKLLEKKLRIVGWDKTVPAPGKGFKTETLTQVQGSVFCDRVDRGLLRLESWSKLVLVQDIDGTALLKASDLKAAVKKRSEVLQQLEHEQDTDVESEDDEAMPQRVKPKSCPYRNARNSAAVPAYADLKDDDTDSSSDGYRPTSRKSKNKALPTRGFSHPLSDDSLPEVDQIGGCESSSADDKATIYHNISQITGPIAISDSLYLISKPAWSFCTSFT
ncbi:hypothetical protein K525DRAFT_246759, partial [Schizophyllum commune Loenen D]